MDRTIRIGGEKGRDVKFRATARTPRLYRLITGRDMIIDMNNLSKAFKETKKKRDEGAIGNLTTEHYMIFEDSAYVMARHADPEMKEQSADEWLDTFDMFDIFEIFPQLMELWNLNTVQTSESKKK